MNLETPGTVQGGTTAENRDPIRFDIVANYFPSAQNIAAPAASVAAGLVPESATVAQKGEKQ